MKEAWKSTKLRNVCELINGRAYSKPELLANGKYRVLRVGNFFTNNHWYYSDLELEANKYCDTGDLLYAWSASFGPRIWLGDKVIFHYHIWKVVHNPALIDQKFLFMFFLWDTELVKEEQGTGTTMTHVSKGSMEDRTIQLPPLPEQKRIVGILDEAFDGIATAKSNAEKNLQNARALFESHLQSVFTQRGDDWVEKPLGTLANFRNGINYTKGSKGEHVKIVGVKDFQKSFWVPSENLDSVTIDGKLNEEDILKNDDILTVRSNGNPELIGRCILAGNVSGKISHSGFTIRIRLLNGELLPTYVCHFMKCKTSRKRLTDGGTGVNIKSLNQQTLSSLCIPYPPASRQKALVASLESISSETQRLESIYQQKLAALEALKKSLLHQAFSGQL